MGNSIVRIELRRKSSAGANVIGDDQLREAIKNICPDAKQVKNKIIEKYFDDIQSALARGVSWKNIVAMLRNYGVVICKKTLEKFHFDETQRRSALVEIT